jgi:hypothetical protein
MTTESKKQKEERYVRTLLEGMIQFTSIEAGERPDFWIRCSTEPDFAVEVTEYHPEAQGIQGVPRKEVESRWRDELHPVLDQERRSKPSLLDVRVHLGFSDKKLPGRRLHKGLAQELVSLVEDVASRLTAPGQDAEVVLLSRSDLERVVKTIGPHSGDIVFRAKEDWPQVSEHLSFLTVTRWWGVVWPPWGYPELECAWLGPDTTEFRRILDGKARLASKYDLGGASLWLLIVCEDFGDLQSHVFPRDASDFEQLVVAFQKSGLDFQASPFSQVWLLSAFSGGRLPIYPLLVAI